MTHQAPGESRPAQTGKTASDHAEPLIHGLQNPARVLVMGASSGIGLALACRLAQDERVGRLILAARTVTGQPAIMDLATRFPERVLPCNADITSEADLSQLADFIRGNTSGLDLVINTAGVLQDPAIRPEKTVSQLNMSALQHAFAVNAFGPVLLAKALAPLMRHGEPSVFASLSARVGSIGDNRLGGWYGYRAAKAAQNQLLKTFSIEFARMNRQGVVLMLHPGTTDTPLSGPFQANVPAESLFAPDRAAGHLLDIIGRCTPQDTGRFFAWDGAPIAW